MTLTVHHLNESRSQRVLLLLEELGTPYEIRYYQRDPKTMMAPASLKAVHPLGKSPVVTDGDDTLAETGLIIDTLIDRYGAGGTLRPQPGTPDHLRYGYYLHYAEGSLMPLVLMSMLFGMLPKQTPLPLRPLAAVIGRGARAAFVGPQLARHLNFLEGELKGRDWFAGPDFTGADAIMSFPLQALRAQGGLGARPNLAAWLDRLEARPAWARATAKGGPLSLKFGS